MKNILKPLSKSDLISFELTASAATDAAIPRKMLDLEKH